MLHVFKSSLAVALLGLMLVGPAQAFRSTDFESFTDPDYMGYRPARVLLTIVSDGSGTRRIIQERMTKALEKEGITVFDEYDLFIPTRQWSAEERDAVLAERNIDALLTITAGATAAAVIPVMMQSYADVSVIGNTAFATSTSYPVYAARSTAEFSGVLFDLGKHRVAWYADVFTKAAGTLFVSSKGDAKGAVKGIINGLKEDGHIGKR